MKKSFCLTGLFLVLVINIAGQNPAQEQYNAQQRAEQFKRWQEETERRRREEGLKRLRTMLPPEQQRQQQRNQPKPTAVKQAFSGSPLLSEKDKNLIAPEAEFRDKYREFLKQPKTGLLRLLLYNCDASPGDAKACLGMTTLPDDGSAYSFRRNEYQMREWADLVLSEEFFASDAVFGQGWLVSLGDVEIENLSTAAREVSFLSSITPANKKSAIDKQYQQSVEGIEADNLVYRKFVRVKENTTYLLRSVAYQGKYLKYDGTSLLDMTTGDTRDDVVVAFRVLKRDAQGNVTILWKELSRKSAPEVKIKD